MKILNKQITRLPYEKIKIPKVQKRMIVINPKQRKRWKEDWKMQDEKDESKQFSKCFFRILDEKLLRVTSLSGTHFKEENLDCNISF